MGAVGAWELHRDASVIQARLIVPLLLSCPACAIDDPPEAGGGAAIRHVPRELANATVLDAATRIAFAGDGPVREVVLEPCRVAMTYADGAWTKGEWAALGHDGFTYSGTLYIEPEEAGEPSGVAMVGGGFGAELWGYRLRYEQRPAEEPNTVYRWAVGLDLVTVMTGDVPDRFGQVSALTRVGIDPLSSPTDADLACLPAEMAAEIRARAAAGR